MSKLLPDLFLIGYGLMFLVVGMAGVFIAPWELERVFRLDPAWLTQPEGATFLNQYRFLKAAEAAFGLFCVYHRRDILAGGQNFVIFVAGCFLAILARALSWAVDGPPRTAFVLFLVLEALTLILVWRHARNGRDQLK
jgi:membrane protein implicated in regulation of membrane protease activity